MTNQEIIIKLINEIDYIVDNQYYEEDFYLPEYSDLLNDFSDKLDEILVHGLNSELLDMIRRLEHKDIFFIHNGEKYINNKIRIEIEKYLIDHEALYLDFELIKDNIKNNYQLAKYLKDKSKIVELVDCNEKVLLLIDTKFATKELIEKQLKKSDFVSKIFLGLYGKNSIYQYSMFYRSIENIDEIVYNQLKDMISVDVTKYIQASDLVKQNRKIQELVVSIDPRMKVYMD